METPEEIMRGLTCCKFGGMCNECPYDSDDEQNEIDIEDCTKALAEDAYEYVQQLVEKIPHWISVQERLPGNLEKCLTFSPEGGIKIGCYTEVGFILSNFGGEPTHWMLMPEHPKEGGQ